MNNAWYSNLSHPKALHLASKHHLPHSHPRFPWSDESMEMAHWDVMNSLLGVRRAAFEYGVTKSTLSDRITGQVQPGSKSGAPYYLDDKGEEELVKWISGCAEVGCAKLGLL